MATQIPAEEDTEPQLLGEAVSGERVPSRGYNATSSKQSNRSGTPQQIGAAMANLFAGLEEEETGPSAEELAKKEKELAFAKFTEINKLQKKRLKETFEEERRILKIKHLFN